MILNWTVSVILTTSQMLPLAIDPSGSGRIPQGAINSIMDLRQCQARISVPHIELTVCVSCFKPKHAAIQVI